MSKVFVIDATLREGCQSPNNVPFSVKASVEIAHLLEEIGVDCIECGHPAISGHERARIAAVRDILNHTPLLCHARARVEDVQAAADIGADWVGVFFGVSPLSLAARHNIPKEEVHRRIEDVVKTAKRLGLKIRFTVEDTSRTDIADAVAAYQVALNAGADRICFSDTVGLLDPRNAFDRISEVTSALKGADLEIHFHDDRGIALASALSAIDAGANWISTSVNGLGERCGIVDTCALLGNLEYLGKRPLEKPALMHKLSERVAAYARCSVDPQRPVIGRHAFTHTARLHKLAVEKDPSTYDWIAPERLGRDRNMDPGTGPYSASELVVRAKSISATEMQHYRKGPGDRFVMIDESLVRKSGQSCIVRKVSASELDDNYYDDFVDGHVDSHAHSCDSLYMFIGDAKDLSGLQVEVTLGEEVFQLQSPASVFIPSGMEHFYSVIDGSGLLVNHILSGSYKKSVLDSVFPQKKVRTKILSASPKESVLDPVVPLETARAKKAEKN